MILTVGAMKIKSNAKYYMIIKNDYFGQTQKTNEVKVGTPFLTQGVFNSDSKLKPSITKQRIQFTLFKDYFLKEKQIG